MLWFGGLLCFIVFRLSGNTDFQNLALGVILVFATVVTTIFQTIQEGTSDQVMEALKQLAPTSVSVVRNGELIIVPAKSLVPGDICKVCISALKSLAFYFILFYLGKWG